MQNGEDPNADMHRPVQKSQFKNTKNKNWQRNVPKSGQRTVRHKSGSQGTQEDWGTGTGAQETRGQKRNSNRTDARTRTDKPAKERGNHTGLNAN